MTASNWVAVWPHSTGEALVVEKLQQSSKTLDVAVMRRGGEKQLVLEVRGQRPDGGGAQRISRVFTAARWRNVVGLVDNQKIVRPRIGRLVARRQRFTEQAQRAFTLEKIDRSDEPREM